MPPTMPLTRFKVRRRATVPARIPMMNPISAPSRQAKMMASGPLTSPIPRLDRKTPEAAPKRISGFTTGVWGRGRPFSTPCLAVQPLRRIDAPALKGGAFAEGQLRERDVVIAQGDNLEVLRHGEVRRQRQHVEARALARGQFLLLRFQ